MKHPESTPKGDKVLPEPAVLRKIALRRFARQRQFRSDPPSLSLEGPLLLPERSTAGTILQEQEEQRQEELSQEQIVPIRGSVAPTVTVDSHPASAASVPASAPADWIAPVSVEEDLGVDPFASSDWHLLSVLVAPAKELLRRYRSRRRVPAFLQMSATECGAACLAMLLTFYGYQTSIAEVSTFCGVGRDGLSAGAIVRAARRYGLQARGMTLHDVRTFAQLTGPVIAHWNFNHFLIVEHWTPKRVLVVDPALGRRTLTPEEFDHGFTGIVLECLPGEQFQPRRGAPRSAMLTTYIRSTWKLAPASLWQILFTSVLLLAFGLLLPVATAVVLNRLVPRGLQEILLAFGLGMIGLTLAQVILSTLRAMVLVKLQARVDTALTVSFFTHLLTLPLRFFQLRSSGDLLNRLQSNQLIRDMVNTQLIGSVLDAISVLAYLGILAWLSPPFALLTALFGAAQAGIILSTNTRLRELFRLGLDTRGKAQGYLTEALVQIATLKAAGTEREVRSRWLRLFFAEMAVRVRRDYFVAFVNTGQDLIRSVAPLVLLLVGAELVIGGRLPLGTMLALLSLSTSFLTPLQSLTTTVGQLQQISAHLERIAEVMQAEPEQATGEAMTPPKLHGHIELREVGFQYDPHSKSALHDITVTITPGQKVALVGRSGAGKSTLGKLLLGLYLPTQGAIFYDHVPLQRMNYQQVRAQFGVVMQEVGIFNGSMRENIALNAPGVGLEEVVRAAQAACLHEEIMRMPMQYETMVSEGGNAISGGQRQRLALARALVRTPAVLLLDEATSSLDVVTERVVEQQLATLRCTQIIIAHRLSTIRHADQILVIEQGTIVERGTHEDLLRQQGPYASLISQQLANGELKEDVSLSLQPSGELRRLLTGQRQETLRAD